MLLLSTLLSPTIIVLGWSLCCTAIPLSNKKKKKKSLSLFVLYFGWMCVYLFLFFWGKIFCLNVIALNSCQGWTILYYTTPTRSTLNYFHWIITHITNKIIKKYCPKFKISGGKVMCNRKIHYFYIFYFKNALYQYF